MGHSRSLLLYFRLFYEHLTANKCSMKFAHKQDSKPCSLVSEATTLPTVPQSQPSFFLSLSCHLLHHGSRAKNAKNISFHIRLISGSQRNFSYSSTIIFRQQQQQQTCSIQSQRLSSHPYSGADHAKIIFSIFLSDTCWCRAL